MVNLYFRAVHILSQIQDMRNGVMVENKIVSIADQVRMKDSFYLYSSFISIVRS